MKTPTPRHGAYLRQSSIAALLIFATMAAFDYLVDPYGLMDTRRIEGFNARKPLAASHVRIVKPYQVTGYRPRTLIAGNSRPEMGIDPANSCWPMPSRPVFNLGLPGAGTFMQARVIEHAQHRSRVDTTYWGLDFIDFFTPRERENLPRKEMEFEKRLRIHRDGTPNGRYWWQATVDHFQALASLDALQDSLATLLEQNNPNSSTIRRDGFNPARDYLDIIHWEGQWVLFAQKREELRKSFSRPGLELFPQGRHTSPQFEDVRRILQNARKQRIRMVLFINPYHIDYLHTLYSQGHWGQFERWKRVLTSLASEFQVPLWDFSGIDAKITEAVPARNDRKTIMRWFWEPAHYRRELGDLMLGRMSNLPCATIGKTTFGTRLTPENIEAHLARIRTDFNGHLASSSRQEARH